MAFRSQDLIVNAFPHGAIDALRTCIWGTRICIRPTIHCRWYPTFVTCWRWTHITCWRGTCLDFTNPCGVYPTHCPQFSDPCGGHPSVCPVGTLPDITDFTTVINPGAIVINEVADIRTLRAQLGEVMEKLDELEQKGLEAGLHSPQELEQMENELRNALDEIRSARGGEQGRSGGQSQGGQSQGGREGGGEGGQGRKR